jgi:hypothetical protein
MGFFTGWRAQFKANALVSHLEFAVNRWPRDPVLGLNHLKAASKALTAIKSSGTHKTIAHAGWRYVVHLSTQIGMILAVQGPKEAMRDCDLIIEQAIKWRDEAYKAESGEELI